MRRLCKRATCVDCCLSFCGVTSDFFSNIDVEFFAYSASSDERETNLIRVEECLCDWSFQCGLFSVSTFAIRALSVCPYIGPQTIRT